MFVSFTWLVMISAIGWLAWPAMWRIFPNLEDRGFGVSRIGGLLFSGFVFWLLGTFHLIRINAGGAAIGILLLCALAFLTSREERSERRSWLRANRTYVIITELVFVIAFGFWAFVRANNPEITGTEKPMELAFLNAIAESQILPAKDPWLAGYAISYYHFGYVILAMLRLMTGTSSGIAFNLGNALWFGLVAAGTYSLFYNLLAWKARNKVNPLSGLLGPLFILITGNLEAVLDVLHSRHYFWQASSSAEMTSRFWTWVGLENLETAPLSSPAWIPQRNWWWWRASRVIRDLDLLGRPIDLQSIDEFPFFSFLLADNHPHLLAFPFVLLAIAFTIQIFRRPRAPWGRKALSGLPILLRRWMIALAGVGLFVVLITSISTPSGFGSTPGSIFLSILRNLVIFGAVYSAVVFVCLNLMGFGPGWLDREEMIIGGFIFGSLSFLNTWDFPIYLSLFFSATLIVSSEELTSALRNAIASTLGVMILGIIFFLPWYPTFASQAGGILPHVLHPTRLLHFVIMFGTALVPITAWLAGKFFKRFRVGDLLRLLAIALGLPLGLMIMSIIFARLVFTFIDPSLLEYALSLMPATSLDEAIRVLVQNRITSSWTSWALGLIIAVASLLIHRKLGSQEEPDPDVFVLLLILVGSLLILGPENFYLRDQFGLRMNTIFKFYFAAWILWGLAAAYALSAIWSTRSRRSLPIKAFVILPLVLGLFYPVLGTWTKTNGFQPTFGRTLDGAMHPSYAHPDDREAVAWINANLKDGVIAEAVGGSYTYYARISAHTGLATVLGWPGHESQWRGGYEEIGSRQADIHNLFTSGDWNQTDDIMQQYGIDYVYVGELERNSYRPLLEAKFDAYLDLIYKNESVSIYAVRERDVD